MSGFPPIFTSTILQTLSKLLETPFGLLSLCRIRYDEARRWNVLALGLLPAAGKIVRRVPFGGPVARLAGPRGRIAIARDAARVD